jgi:hypothetical protein
MVFPDERLGGAWPILYIIFPPMTTNVLNNLPRFKSKFAIVCITPEKIKDKVELFGIDERLFANVCNIDVKFMP